MGGSQKRIPKQIMKAYILILIGSALTAFSFDLFFLPNKIAPGGISGVAALLNHLTGVRVGVASIALNIPLFLIGYRAVGGSFAFRSLVAMLLLSVLIDLIPEMPLTDDRLLASIYGGVLMGVGLGLALRVGATTGGTDLAAKIIHTRWPVVSVGALLFALDCLVVAAAGVVFDAQAALYALVAILVCAKVMDLILQGSNSAKQLLIISDSAELIAKRVTADMDRGATLLSATGAYSGEPRGMMLCVVRNIEVARLKEIIAEVDPKAFVTVSNVHEAMGEGFAGLGKK